MVYLCKVMTEKSGIYRFVLVSLVCTMFASFPNMALLSCEWQCIPAEERSVFMSCTLIRFVLFWLFSGGLLLFNEKLVVGHTLLGRIWPNVLFTLLAFALYKYVTYLICPGFDRFKMIPTFQFIVMGMMGLLLGYTDYLSRMHRKKDSELQQLQIEWLESRCTALTNQINPHFFFNSLSAISSLVRKKDEKLTIVYIDHLSDIFRYILQSGNKGLVTVEKELEFARSFCQVMEIRYAGKLDSEHRMQARVYAEEEKALVVENRIYAKQFKQETHGTGLLNLSKRFVLLTGKEVRVTNDGKMFRVVLPLK